VEFIVAAADPSRRRALQARLLASGLEIGSEIESAEQLQRLLAPRVTPAEESAHDVVVVIADGADEQAQFVSSALGAGVPVLIWPLGAALESPNVADTGHRPQPPRLVTARLTTRERQVLALVASGIANKGIARALGVSPNTVKFHLSALFHKLGVSTRAEAIAAAARSGEIAL
jgi:DNA-binding CsgD family transcriptional regulator